MIEAINITNKSDQETFYVNQAYLEKNKGIVNDRYYENFKNKKEQVTLIDIEEINLFNKFIRQKIDYKDFRRNIIISGFKICEMVGEKIKINNSILKIHEICQPCNYLQKKLNSPNLIKRLLNKSGVRAEILSSGYIGVGSKIIKIK
jgi:MOSC domain-containing protein YiiM